MPLIKDRQEIDDIWAFVPDDAPLSPGGCITVSLGRFRSETELLLSRNTEIGVRLEPADDPHELEEHLDRWPALPEEAEARWFAERTGLLLTAAILFRTAPAPVAEAFAATRLPAGRGRIAGAQSEADTDALLERLGPVG